MTGAGRPAWVLTGIVSLAVSLTACGDAGNQGAQPDSGPSGELPSSAAASCVETYAVQTLQGRDFAFDGTVADIGPASSGEADIGYSAATFDVHEWYRGGSPDRVTVAMPGPDRVSSDGVQGRDDATYGVGTRLLVSGEPQWGGKPLEDPIAWMCGFTRYHDEGTAAQWRAALTT
jgi:hypothetical protein